MTNSKFNLVVEYSKFGTYAELRTNARELIRTAAATGPRSRDEMANLIKLYLLEDPDQDKIVQMALAAFPW